MTPNVVVISGGARGIGFAAATSFARQGAAIALLDRNGEAAHSAAERLRNDFGGKAIAVATDITKRESVRAARLEIEKQLGRQTVLVNSAAVVDDKTFLESTEEDWNRVLQPCLFGAFNCLHEFLPGMVEARRGRVIFLASDSAKIGQARLSYYAAAKAAVIALAKSVAQEVGPSGVTINVVSPGTTDTEMRQEREASLRSQMTEEQYARRTKAVLKLYPAGRIGKPEDIAAAISFLASDEASWITGQVLSVNGGFTMA